MNTVSCSVPQNVVNGRINYNHTLIGIGGSVNFSCNAGYLDWLTLKPTGVLHCTSVGGGKHMLDPLDCKGLFSNAVLEIHQKDDVCLR